MRLGLVLCLFLFALLSEAATLPEKLQHQWELYGQARDLLLARVKENRAVARDEWEAILQPRRDLAFTAQDLRDLRASQRQRILAARERAAAESVIDFDRLRKSPGRVSSFCAAVPKGGMLHIHPSGTFSRKTVRGLFRKNRPELPVAEILNGILPSRNALLYDDEIAWLRLLGPNPAWNSLTTEAQSRFESFLFLPPGKQPFPRFNSVFHFLGTAVQTDADYKNALLDFARRAVAQGVSYVEFTGGFSPELVPVLQRIETETGLVVRVNRSFNRTQAPTDIAQRAEALLAAAPSPWLVGIDFLDNEDGNPALEKGQWVYGKVLLAVHEGRSRLRRTMHSGELGDPRNPRDALLLGAERLGHGVLLQKDALTLEYAAARQVPVEVNLSSNLRLTKVERIQDHPFLDYLRLGLSVSLSTDDEGIFDTDINRECELALRGTDLTYAEFRAMAFHSLAAAFASEADKAKLREKLERSYQAFEQAFLRKHPDVRRPLPLAKKAG